jgi:hypothetical protein
MLPCPSRLASLAFLSAIMALLGASCGDSKSPSAEAPSATPSASAAPSADPSTNPSAAPTSTASASATAALEPPPSESLPPDAVDTTAAPAEAQRKTLRSAADDPAFYANRNFFAEKYGGASLPLPLSLQAVPLPRGRRALLVTGQGAALEKPLIIVVEKDHSMTWSKDRPLAGTRERARELTLTRGSRGEVLLFWYDEPTKILAAREWTYEGGIFADYAVLSSEGCDSVAVLHWPGQGWVAALVDSAGLHCQLLSEQGKRVWPGEGVTVPLPSDADPRGRVAARPVINVLKGEVVEVTVGKRKIKISREGAVTPAPR